MKEKKKIFITGICGGIGMSLANRLVEDYNVEGLSRNNNSRLDERVKFYQKDISKEDLSLDYDSRIVIHLAALTNAKLCEENPDLAYSVNVEGTERFMRNLEGKKLEKFIYISTGYVYGTHDKPHKEIDSINPLNEYAKTKYQGELIIQKYQREFPIVVLRPFFIYGPDTNRDKIIYRILRNVENNLPINLNKDNKPILSLLHIDDFIDIFQLIIESDIKGIFNVASEERKSIKEITEIIAKIKNKKPHFHLTDLNQPNWIADINKIKQKGFSPKGNLEKTISLL